MQYFDIADFNPEPGFKFRFTGSDETQTCLHLCQITEVIAGKNQFIHGNIKGKEEVTFVTWEEKNEGRKTRVMLKHAGLERISKQCPAFAKKSFVAGWAQIVGTSLKEFLKKENLEA